MKKFKDRLEAGKILASYLAEYKNNKDIIILALPRGGVPVAFEVAKQLYLPLDVFIVRKLGVPGQEEFAMGAIASGHVTVLNSETIQSLAISEQQVNSVIAAEQKELQRRNQTYRQNTVYPELRNKTVILIDDGIATGATIKAALQSLKKLQANKIIIAVPVAEPDIIHELEQQTYKVICPLTPKPLYSVGRWYDNFSQTSDEEVINLLTWSKRD